MKTTTSLAGIPVGQNFPTRYMGVINVSLESFYKGSIYVGTKEIAKKAASLTEAGADFIDLGAMSTAPYLNTRIPVADEIKRIVNAVKAIRKATDVPISVDTTQGIVAQSALDVGAQMINDISGLSKDESMLSTARKARGIILMANPQWVNENKLKNPVSDTRKIFRKIIQKTAVAGIATNRIVLDPGIGFFRRTQIPWWKWDLSILKNLSKFHSLGYPILIALSRKSFLGHLLNEKNPEKRLGGSLGATVMAVLGGASIIRTHDIVETKQAVEMAFAIKKA